jgi:hypothetical protein
MADKKLTLIVQAKNMVAQGLSAAGSAISSFASRAASAFGTVAKWFGILGSALGGFSVVKAVGGKCAGAILTGMGRDGAKGLLAMREAGGRTLGQDEASCVVYGMPRAAFEIGAVERQYPITRIGAHLLSACAVSTEG